MECYVLEAIGRLEVKERDALVAMTPKLSMVFGFEGSWHEILQHRLGLPPDMMQTIRSEWVREIAGASDEAADPRAQPFAESFVDRNFRLDA